MSAYREVWTDALAPGGFVCSICGCPVESEPCPNHAPEVGDEGGDPKPPPSIGDTCCGKCPGDTCYVDGVTGA